jgi:hypothetical protein
MTTNRNDSLSPSFVESCPMNRDADKSCGWNFKWLAVAVWVAAWSVWLDPVSAAPPDVRLALDGRVLQPVVVGRSASEPIRKAAAELAETLKRISGAPFQVTEGDGRSGLAVGVPADFSALPFDPEFGTETVDREKYLLRTHADGAWLLGASDRAVEHAVWDFLHRLGYRLFFLTDTWEVVPETADLHLAIDCLEKPDFVTRQAPRGAPWSDAALWNRWRTRNRIASAFSLNTGHAYDGIIRANAAAFRANPDYYALVGGERRLAGQVDGGGNIKFCISNPGLRKLVADHAVRVMTANPDQDSISMDPSDGGNWCECDACAETGSVSDRVVILANEVAEAINSLGLGRSTSGSTPTASTVRRRASACIRTWWSASPPASSEADTPSSNWSRAGQRRGPCWESAITTTSSLGATTCRGGREAATSPIWLARSRISSRTGRGT